MKVRQDEGEGGGFISILRKMEHSRGVRGECGQGVVRAIRPRFPPWSSIFVQTPIQGGGGGRRQKYPNYSRPLAGKGTNTGSHVLRRAEVRQDNHCLSFQISASRWDSQVERNVVPSSFSICVCISIHAALVSPRSISINTFSNLSLILPLLARSNRAGYVGRNYLATGPRCRPVNEQKSEQYTETDNSSRFHSSESGALHRASNN